MKEQERVNVCCVIQICIRWAGVRAGMKGFFHQTEQVYGKQENANILDVPPVRADNEN